VQLGQRRPPGATAAAGHGRWRVRDAPSARAASAGKLRALPVPPRPLLAGRLDPYVIPYVNPYVIPYVIPYAQGWRTPGLGN
jgi:hypothetical protein